MELLYAHFIDKMIDQLLILSYFAEWTNCQTVSIERLFQYIQKGQ